MQIIHDVAPGAKEMFHTAFNGEADFAQGIIDLQQAGARVIFDDVLYYNEPMFQDGIIAQAVDTVKASGVAYFSAAGNAGRKSYQSRFRSSGIAGLGGVLHDFDPGPGVSAFQKSPFRLALSLPPFNGMNLTFPSAARPGLLPITIFGYAFSHRSVCVF